ncbi:UPF0496 protein 1-like [Typha angustifolia]|uniref:UPF0496 protein 1-like n=1 Tax=Typha angustifolia TaxID=59011 RepID=UPI003C2C7174
MGGQLSKRAPLPTRKEGNGDAIQYTTALSLYEDACLQDPELQLFDTTLQQRTSRALSTLAHGVQVRSLSFGSLKEVTGCLLEMNQEVVKIILECKKDIWKNKELFDLVEEYFENSLQSLDFCGVVERCLNKARDSQLIVQVALQLYDEEEEEEEEVEDGKMSKYKRTLEELKHFKAMGDPFSEEFFKVFHLLHEQQLSMLEKLLRRKKELSKKVKSIKTWRKISSVIFASAFAAVLICSVVAAAMAAPPVAAALAAATAIPLGSMGKWFDSLLNKYEDVLNGKKDVINSMQVGTYIAIKDLENIRLLVDQLELQITSLLRITEFSLQEEEAVRFGIQEIKRKLGVFTKSVEDLGRQVDQCSRDIRRARTVVLQKIINHTK